MAGTGDEGPVPLRIGGWLPPTGRRPVRPEDAAATALLPVVTGTGAEPSGTAPQPPRSLPERGRRRAPGGRRWRVTALVAVATVATAVGVPLLASRTTDPAGPDRQVQPAPPGPTRSTDPAVDPVATTATARATSAGTSAAASRGASRSPSTSQTGTVAGPPTPGTPAAPPPQLQPDQPNQLPPPPPPATGFTASVEAEGAAAERRGRAKTRPVTGASGGTVVTGIGDGSENTIRFSQLVVPTAGRYTLTLHYVSGERRSGNLTVNGDQTRVSFADTGSDSGPVGTVSVVLSLRAGANTVELGDRRDRVADLDRIVVTGSAG